MLFLISSLYTPSRAEKFEDQAGFGFFFFDFGLKRFCTRWCMFFGGLKFVGVTLELYWKPKMFEGSPVNFVVKIVASGKRCANLLKFSRQKT